MHNKRRIILYGALFLCALMFSLSMVPPAFAATVTSDTSSHAATASKSLGVSMFALPQPRTPYMQGYRQGYRDAVTDCNTSAYGARPYRPTAREEGYMEGYNYARANDPDCTSGG